MYLTKQGDQWDSIAKLIYGNEKKLYLLLDANPEYSDIYLFEAGVSLKVPEDVTEESEVLPPWRK